MGITAYGRVRDWRHALSLLDEMRDHGVAPDVISFSSAISACGKNGQWERALSLFHELEASQLQADKHTYNALLDALRTQPARADEIFKHGMARGFYADFECLKGGVPHLDLQSFSDGAAEAAVRWWIDEMSCGCKGHSRSSLSQ